MNMNKPKMILFDYGHTLLSEPGFNTLRGTQAIMKYATKNSRNLTPDQINEFSQELFRGICGRVRDIRAELHNLNFQKLLYEYLQIEFSIPQEEQELVFWDNAAPGAQMPNIESVISYLHEHGIRSGVISNIGFSGGALTNRINRLLPYNHFEFIIASSEYMIRKPHPMIFELAVRKASLATDDIWFCGDDVKFDVEGAHGAGLFPVWYHSFIPNDLRDKPQNEKPECTHLYINDWLELIEVLERLK